MVRRISLAWLPLAAALLAFDCPPTSPEVSSRVSHLMECEECNAGELDSVVALGGSAVAELAVRLHTGPPAARVSAYRASLGEQVAAIRRLRSQGPGAGTPDSLAYVNEFLDNYKATYQTRSARALSLIGGSAARDALHQATQMPLRKDVADFVQFVLDSVWTP